MNIDRFDSVVIGSGFGGAVTSCRLAQAGLSVCLLERGRRYPRGSFPRGVDQLSKWMYSESHPGLVEMKPLRTEMIALQAAGYGGGSLVYCNVQMRSAPSVFASGWPEGYSRAALDPYYDLVAYMLGVAQVCETHPLGMPKRTDAFRRAAAALGREEQFFRPNVAVDFSAPGVPHKNHHGVEQRGCTHCGECFIGCNEGAKNTLDHNYLAVAEQRGATVRTESAVYRIEPLAGGGYRVYYKHGARQGEPAAVDARQVFLCAGAINSTEMLLRARDQHRTLPHVSEHLGRSYSANGDFLAFVFDAKEPLHPAAGPCITSAIAYERGEGDEHVWFLVEDGGVAQPLAYRGLVLSPKQRIEGGRALWDDVMRGLGAEVETPPPPEALARTSVLLLMGRDRASGHLTLDRYTHQLRMTWDNQENMRLYNEQARIAADVATALGGQVGYNPLWQHLHQPITIHNLGGCGMSDDPSKGVTDAYGEVHGHPGLFVLDGAILPGAVGANPSHTIAAVAERNIEAVIRRATGNPTWRAPEHAHARRIEEPYDRVRIPVGGTAPPRANITGLTFRETMRGFVAAGTDYLAAERAGRAAGTRMEFTLDITAPDLDRFLNEAEHTAIATGSVRVDGYTPPEGAPVTAGVFNLFSEGDKAGAKKMLYALPFYGQDGQPYLLDGWKDIRPHEGSDVWDATTTLFVSIRRGHTRHGEVCAAGVLHIGVVGAMQMMSTMKVLGSVTALEQAHAIERVGAAFFGTLWRVFVAPSRTGVPATSASSSSDGMRTLVISDLHLGNGGPYDTFAGGDVLPAVLDELSANPLRVILNGDAVDFLLNDDPLVLDVARAVAQAQAAVANPSTAAVFRALGRVLARGGEVVIRLGNHDAELALAETQEVFRRALGQPDEVAARLVFERGEVPLLLEVDGARVLVTHGEHNDRWNRLDYARLPGPGGLPGASPADFAYPPGSLLCKQLLNPLKQRFQMRFADLLKPDFQGAVLTALAVDPTAVKMVFQGSTLTLLWQLFRQTLGPATFADGEGEGDTGVASAVDEAGLTGEERDVLANVLGPGAMTFEGEDQPVLERARLKLARAGTRLYARFHKVTAGDKGERYFSLAPNDDEWKEASRVAKKFRVGAVVFGHTHAARWRSEPGLTFVNTGTWIQLMQLPPSDAADHAWADFIMCCRKNPALDPKAPIAVPIVNRFTGAIVEPHPEGGARVSLLEWREGGAPIVHGETRVAPTTATPA